MAVGTFGEFVPHLFNLSEVLPSASKEKLLAENFSKTPNLDGSGISLPVFLSRYNMKLHNVSITPKMVKMVITNLDLSRASGPACIPVVVLKNYKPELSYILAELFSNCLKESCFPDCWKIHRWSLYFKNYHPVSLLSVVSQVFEKLVNNRVADHLEKCDLFSDFQYGFTSSQSTPDLLKVVSDRIYRVFNRSFNRSGFFQIRYLALFLLFSAIDGFECFWVEKYPFNAGVPQGSIPSPTLFLQNINDLPDNAICDIAICADDTTLHSKDGQASDLRQQLELVSELESNLRDTVE